jgi:hypothetical protein
MVKRMTQRRRFLQGLTGLGLALALEPGFAAERVPLSKPIPSSGERIPVIGVGSWLTFDSGASAGALDRLQPVLQTFFDNGGRLIDSSPMYGTAERVIGELLPRVKGKEALFAATKVWIYGQALGRRQMEASRKLWGVPRFDLMQIHNMLDWEGHLEKPLPGWAAEIDCASWAQVFLKFAVSPPSGPEVDDPVGFAAISVEVVLDHHDARRVARRGRPVLPVQHADQLFHVGHVQADRRFVEDVEGVRILRPPARGRGVGPGHAEDAPWPVPSPA